MKLTTSQSADRLGRPCIWPTVRTIVGAMRRLQRKRNHKNCESTWKEKGLPANSRMVFVLLLSLFLQTWSITLFDDELKNHNITRIKLSKLNESLLLFVFRCLFASLGIRDYVRPSLKSIPNPIKFKPGREFPNNHRLKCISRVLLVRRNIYRL